MKTLITALAVFIYITPAFAVEEWQIKDRAKQSVLARLKDPDSAKILGMLVFGNAVCGSVNAKNSFGGYSGEMLFISAGSVESTFLESDMKQKDFEFIWDVTCR